jgi:hypothetical protein
LQTAPTPSVAVCKNKKTAFRKEVTASSAIAAKLIYRQSAFDLLEGPFDS